MDLRESDSTAAQKVSEAHYDTHQNGLGDLDTADPLHILRQTQQRNAQLEQEIRAYRKMAADLRDFPQILAHALKDLLSIMVGYSALLVDTLPEGKYQELMWAEQLLNTSLKMNNIIEGLLLLACVEQTDVEPTPLDMSTIIAEVERRLEDSIAQTEATWIKPASWPAAMGHAAWVEEVWVNYISNALKYGGRPQIGIPPRIELGWDQADTEGHIRFWVRDNGHGISPDAQARLFIPFTRLDPTCADGHGLGLSIIKRIVEKLNGQVGVESTCGQGSLFFFTLPAIIISGFDLMVSNTHDLLHQLDGVDYRAIEHTLQSIRSRNKGSSYMGRWTH